MQSVGVPMFLFAMLAIVLIGGGYYMMPPPMEPEEQQFTGGEQPVPYQKWEKPVVAMVLTGQMHGYVHPCGCSDPQYGGLVRRYNFIESLKGKGWDVVGLDLGELPQTQGIHAQSLLKFDLAMKALATMGYRGVGIGKHEILLPLGEGLAQTYENNKPKLRPLSISLAEVAPKGMYDGLNARPYEIISLGPKLPTIGVLSMMGPDMRDLFQKQEKFLANQDELPKALNAFAKAGAEIGVILHHEHPNVKDLQGIARMQAIEKQRKEMALACAKFCDDERKKNPKIPPIQVMMILTDEPEPPSSMHRLDAKLPTQSIEIGHKGIYVGMLGFYREAKGKGFRTQYQIVKMGPEWETPESKKADHPVIKLMQKYNDELKRQNMMAKAPRAPHFNQLPPQNQKGLKATFVGTDRCIQCHVDAGDIHGKSLHAKATVTLEKLTNPSLQNHDPECMKCHVTGFHHPGGYNDPIPLADLLNWPAKKTDPDLVEGHNKKMRGVGCESCHGPGSEHVKKTKDTDIHKLMNPYRPSDRERQLEEILAKNPKDVKAKNEHAPLFQTRMQTMSRFCTTCHDEENDVKWGKDGHDVVSKWIGKGIIHRTPKDGAPMNPPAAKADDPPLVIEAVEEKKKQ